MHDKVMGADEADEEFDTTDAQDARDQGEVLREVLLIYPEAMTLDELTYYLTCPRRSWASARRSIEAGKPFELLALVLPS